MTARYALTVLLLTALIACNGTRKRRVLATSSPDERPAQADVDTAADGAGAAPGVARRVAAAERPALMAPAREPAVAPGPPASEAVARTLLAETFRRAGFRIRYDVILRQPERFEFTVDGYDPALRVGYEYIAVSERDTDLTRAERVALAADDNYRILIVDASAEDVIAQQVAGFLTPGQ